MLFFRFSLFIGSILCCVLIGTACRDSTPVQRQYTEYVLAAPPPPEDPGHDHPHDGMMDASLAPVVTSPPDQGEAPFVFETPEPWRALPASGMRMATLLIDHEGMDPLECTLTVLGPESAGLEGNLVRWMGQLDIDPPRGDAFQRYMDDLERMEGKDGLQWTLVDFAPLVKQDDGLNMMVGITQQGARVLFVRLLGPKNIVEGERDRFRQLLFSIRPS